MSLYASVVNFTANTSTGTQDITGSLGGENPKAALFFMSEETTLSISPVTPFHVMMGMTDGTNQFYMLAHSETGVTTGDNYSAAYTDAVVRGVDGTGSQTYKAAFSSWITDGVRINWSDAAPSAFQGFCVLLGGTDLANVYVGTCGTGATVTDPGFAVNQVIMGGIGSTIASGAVADGFNFMYGMGIDTSVFTNSGSSNIGWAFKELDALNSPAPGSVWESDKVISRINDTAASGGFTYNMTVGTWSASGFTTASDNTNSEKVGYMAFEWNSGCDVRLDTFPNTDYTTTGVHKLDYGVDFGGDGTPVLEMISGSGSRIAAGSRDNNNAGTMHIAAHDGTNNYMVGGGVKDGSSTTSTGSSAASKSIGAPNTFNPHTSTLRIIANFDSWATDGSNHNFTTVAGTTGHNYLGWIVVPSGGVSVPVFTNHYLRMMGA